MHMQAIIVTYLAISFVSTIFIAKRVAKMDRPQGD